MADALLSIVFQNLDSLIKDEIGLLWGVNEEMKKLESTFSTIQSVLEDAEQKPHLQENKPIKNWLKKLKYATYEIDDILDDCATEANRLESGFEKEVRLSSFSSYPIVGNIWFRHKIGNRMREIRERLDQIAEERMKLHLREMVVEKRVGFSDPRLTGSFLTEPKVYGRDAEKEKIVQVLINHVNGNHENLLVYPIIGMGGLGKTTLAQLVYNDERVTSHFQAKIWVCVSEPFDVPRILKAIIESATKSPCQVVELDTLASLVQEKLNGKRYLLVLDDVWNEDKGKWEKLDGILKQCGAKGASIITTTRLEMVASIMRTHPSHSYQLTELSNDDCWLLFKQRAFGSEREEHPNLVKIGKEIVKKCVGVPLAAKALGSLLLFKMEEKDWVFVKDSEIWNLRQDEENSILPALRLSYQNLPLPLRRCFAYCSVFEKDTVIEKTDIINLWMANGFISSANGKKEMEDIGNDIWNELHLRSFFQDVKEGFDSYSNFFPIVTFKVHDLMHDLGHSVMEEECQIIEVERPTNNVSKKSKKSIRYLNLFSCFAPLTTIPKELQNNDSLRTLLYTERSMYQSSEEVSVFENNGKLRAFAVRDDYSMTKLASSIGSLKHLRYLRLWSKGITTLPDSICSLWNLQTLNLDGCFWLERLPENMRRLRKLRHLLIRNCRKLEKTPPYIGELTCLKMLGMFIVQQRKGCRLDELKCLDLGESLSIKHLDMVENVKDAQEANLIAKQNLRSLELFWNVFGEEQHAGAEQVLQALQPSSDLKTLKIYSFMGTQFPQWMSDKSSLKNIVKMELYQCNSVPLLHQLPSLRYLDLSWICDVEYIINDDNNYEAPVFPCLEELTLYWLPELRSLLSKEEERRGPLFPCLRKLKIEGCLELTTFPKCLPALEKLEISQCYKLTTLPKCLPALENLEISKCFKLTTLPDNLGNFTSLQSLSISHCFQLASIPASFQNLTKLQSLKIKWCPQLRGRCVEGGEDWDKIKHVPRVTISSI